jgi:hypothetical protein
MAWTPKRDDLSEEGFGYFRDTWLIRDIGIREAKTVMALESTLAELAGRLSADPEDFDLLANAVEDGHGEDLPERLKEHASFSDLESYLDDEQSLEGLELGVSGLVHALSAVGCWPAASCRGHPTSYAWSDHPVVYLAADNHRATVLQPLLVEAGCGFNIDSARSDLLMIEAESIENMMALAAVVIRAPRTFVPRRTPRRPIQQRNDQQLDFDFGS